MMQELREFQDTWARKGLYDALCLLNARTPHRFTGIFRFDAPMLRSHLLVDRFDSRCRRCEDMPLEGSPCALVKEEGDFLAVSDVRLRDGITPVWTASPIVAYCGVLIRDSQGRGFGTLCHYDFSPCEFRLADLPLMRVVAEMIFDSLAGKSTPPPPRIGMSAVNKAISA